MKPKKPIITKKPDPFLEAQRLIEERNQEIVNKAGQKYQECIQDIQKEFGVNIKYETTIIITKN